MTERARARRFGFAMSVVCSLLAFSCWRHDRALPWPAPFTLATALAVLAALAPESLIPFEVRWFAFAKRLGRVNSAIVLTITYHLVVTPAGLLWRLFGGDPLELRARRESYWRPVEPRAEPDRYEKAF